MTQNLQDLKESISASIADTKPSSKQSSGPNKRPRNYKNDSSQWGNGKTYATQEDFNKFFTGQGGKQGPYLVNGHPWFWCDNCNRMGNHSTAKCFYNTENPAKKRRPTQSAPQFGKSHFSNENSQFSKHESANITALDDIPQTDQHINDDSSSVGSFDADDIELSHDETTLLGMLDP